MSTTEIHCLERSTNLLGTILHLDDLIGTFAGRRVAILSDSLPFTLVAVATRVTVCAALVFLEFGLLFMYSPLLTGALLLGMYFYPVPEIAPPQRPLPRPVPVPTPVSIAPPAVEPPRAAASLPPTTPPHPIAPGTPQRQTPAKTDEERKERLLRRSLLLPSTPISPLNAQHPLYHSMISFSPSSDKDSSEQLSTSMISPPTSHATAPRTRSLSSSDLDLNLKAFQIASISSKQSPPESPSKLPDIAADTAMLPANSTVVSPRDQLYAIIDQALGHDGDNLSNFFINHLLPDNITAVEYDGDTQSFTIRLSAPREATIPRVGSQAITGVLGSTLKIQDTIRGRLDIDDRSLSFEGNPMQLLNTYIWIPTTQTLTGLRRNFNGTITLTGQNWATSGNLTGTYQEFTDTFSHVTWKPA